MNNKLVTWFEQNLQFTLYRKFKNSNVNFVDEKEILIKDVKRTSWIKKRIQYFDQKFIHANEYEKFYQYKNLETDSNNKTVTLHDHI